MDLIQKFVDQIKLLLTWWVIVSPWEKGIRVRFGNRIKMLSAGVHFRIPMFDKIYAQTVRSRNISGSIQTVTTIDGIALSLSLIIQYSVSDVFTLYNTLYHPEMTIQNMIMGSAANFITSNKLSDCSVNKIQDSFKSIELDKYGIKLENISVGTYAIVKTFRLIQDSSYVYEGYRLDDIKQNIMDIEFIMWLSENHSDVFYKYNNDDDFGRKAYEDLYEFYKIKYNEQTNKI